MGNSDNTPYEKVGNADPVSIADEAPFDIPDSWEWVRISSITSVVTKGTTPRGGNVSYLESGIGFLRAENIAGFDLLDKNNLNYIDEATHNNYLKRSILLENDILITIAGTLGRTGLVRKEDLPLNANQAVSIVRVINPALTNLLFLILALNSPMIQKALTTQKKITAIPNLTLEIISDCIIPLPPINEQARIVDEYNRVSPLLTEYNDRYQSIQELNIVFPEMLRKSILQTAVQGKLVPQDPNDEPASVLLERIRAKKEKLIAAGKIKRDKSESIIFRRDNSHYEKINGKEVCIDEEIPFEIPESWAWTRIFSLGAMVRGKGIKRTETVPEGLPCVRYGEIYTTYNVSFDFAKSFIPDEIDRQCLHFSKGDIIFTLTGENKVDIAKAVAYTGDSSVAAGGDLAYWTAHGMNPFYLVYYMASPYCIEQKRRTATGDIIVHISTEKVGRFLIPVPPLDEQNRIVEATQKAFVFVDTL